MSTKAIHYTEKLVCSRWGLNPGPLVHKTNAITYFATRAEFFSYYRVMNKQFVKTLGVAWVGVACFIFAYLVSMGLDAMTPTLDERKPKWKIFLEVCVQFGIIGAIIYGSRVFIKNIPFPLEGWYGYEHSALGELRSLPLMVFIFMFFQQKTQDKMRYIMPAPKA